MIDTALIGVGYWGQKLLGYIDKSDAFHLKHACNSKTDLNGVWRDVDAVIIATPNETHYPLARAALEHGKHVLVEKPPAMTYNRCVELQQLAEANNLVLMTDYNYTMSEALQKARTLVRRIGRVLAIDITIKRVDRLQNRDAYWVLGSHAMSILDMFVPLYLLKFRRLDMVKEDGRVRSGALAFGDSAIGGRILVDLKGRKQTQVLVYGQQGMIVYNPLRRESLVMVGDGLNLGYKFNERHNVRRLLEYYARAIRGETKDNLHMAISISRILEDLGCPK